MDQANEVFRRMLLHVSEDQDGLGVKVVGALFTAFALKWAIFDRKPAPQKLRYAAGARYKANPSKAEVDKVFAELEASFFENMTSKKRDPKRWDYAFRLQQLYNLLDFVKENTEEIWAAAKKDIGRTKGEMVLDAGASLGSIQYCIDNLAQWMVPKKSSAPLWMFPSDSYIIREPLGVCLVIGTFNYAVATSILPLAAAIAAGNAVILKPSEIAPAQSELMARLLPKYLDPAMVRVIEGGADTSKSLVDNYQWGKVFYTGGGKVGAMIATSCAARHVPVCLELGGKTPTIILEDAALGVACRRIVQGKFVNSGQTCIAPDYIVIVGDAARQKQVTEALVAEVKRQYPGDVSRFPEFARIVSDSHFKRVKNLLDSGGKVIHGGKCDASQRFIEPTVLVDCPEDSPVMCEEIFGPLMPIQTARNLDEVLTMLKHRPKPLALYVFGGDQRKIDYVLSHTTSGSACVNEAVFQYINPHLPFGGVGPSGVGSYHGENNFLEFSHSKSVLARSQYIDIPIRYLPYLQEDWVQSTFSFLMNL